MTPYLFALLWGPLLFRGLVCRRCNVTVSSWVDEPLYKTGLTVHPRPNSHFTCLPAHAFHKYNNTKVCVSHRCNNRPILITWFNWYCGKVKLYIYICLYICICIHILYIYYIWLNYSSTHFNGGLTRPPLKLRHRWVITSKGCYSYLSETHPKV